jgi:spermidine synthase
LAIHTWPEHKYASVDLFTCGDLVDSWLGFKLLAEALKAGNYSAMEMKRGVLKLLPEEDFEGLQPVGKEPQVIEGTKHKRAFWYMDM